MSALSEELAASAGELVERGGFAIDAERAREKLRRYQLADPHAWILLVVEAAVLLRAPALNVGSDLDDVWLRFEPRRRLELHGDEFWTRIFSEPAAEDAETLRRHRALQKLVLAANAAHALEPSLVRVDSADREGGERLDLRPGREAEHTLEQDNLTPGLRVQVRQRVQLRRLWSEAPELALVRELCVHAGLPIFIAGERVSWGPRLRGCDLQCGPLPVIRNSASIGEAAVVRQPPTGFDDYSLALVQAGVRRECVKLEPAVSPGLAAVVEVDDLRLDVAQARLLRDEGRAEVLAAVEETRWKLLELAYEEREEHWYWLPDALRGLLSTATSPGRFPEALAASPRLVELAAHFQLERADGRGYRSLAELARSEAVIPWIPPEGEAAPLGLEGVLRLGIDEQDLLERLFGEERLFEASTATHGGCYVGDAIHRYGVAVDLSWEGLRLVLGLAPTAGTSARSEILLLRGGCQIWAGQLPLPIAGLHVAVDGSFTLDPVDPRRLRSDAELARAVVLLLHALDKGLRELAARPVEDPWVSRSCQEFLRWIGEPGGGEALARWFGVEDLELLREQAGPLPDLGELAADHPILALELIPELVDGGRIRRVSLVELRRRAAAGETILWSVEAGEDRSPGRLLVDRPLLTGIARLVGEGALREHRGSATATAGVGTGDGGDPPDRGDVFAARVPEDALVATRVDAEGLRGRLWLGPGAAELFVRARGSSRAQREHLPVPWVVSGEIEASAVPLDRRARAVLAEQGAGLWRSLCERLATHDQRGFELDPRAAWGLRGLLNSLVLRMLVVGTGASEPTRALWAALIDLRVMAIDDGTWASPRAVARERPELYRGLPLERVPVADSPESEPEPEPKAPPELADPGASLTDMRAAGRELAARRATAPTLELVERLRRRLRLLAGPFGGEAEAILASLAVAPEVDAPVVAPVDAGLRLAGKHRIVRAAEAGDPVASSLLCSLVHEALGGLAWGIDEADERALVLALARDSLH